MIEIVIALALAAWLAPALAIALIAYDDGVLDLPMVLVALLWPLGLFWNCR